MHAVAANVSEEEADPERRRRAPRALRAAGRARQQRRRRLRGAPSGRSRPSTSTCSSSINLRSIVLFYRECVPDLLAAAAAEHNNALVVNTSSISGKFGQGWLSVYSATKHGVVGWTEAMNKELAAQGIKSTALCPAFVDTPMTDFAKQHVPAEDMIRPEDIAEAVRYLLKISPACIVPEMMFIRPGRRPVGSCDEARRSHRLLGPRPHARRTS